MSARFCSFTVMAALAASTSLASTLVFSTGNPDGRIAAASRPDAGGKFEIETADDFFLASDTAITSATFTGLITNSGSISQVVVEIYRIFPLDSDTSRTSGPPTFSTPEVPTRVNSPSDNALDSRDSAAGGLTFSTGGLGGSFTAANSVLPGGIHPQPGQTTGGNGSITGEEMQITAHFATPFDLPAGHYFFVPQVAVTGGDFYWLSAPKPIVSPGTPFPLGTTDLQAWTRDAFLDPDWLRIGTDIVGGSPAPTFNMTFTLSGDAIPEPATGFLITGALLGIAAIGRRRR